MLHTTVIIPTYNPNPERLRRTLMGLQAQQLPAETWETILVDNASTEPVKLADWQKFGPPNLRVVREMNLGLTSARLRGIAEARGEDLLVMVDDDNVLGPPYLAAAQARFAANPKLGGLGGRSIPDYEIPPPSWIAEFEDLLAIRDLGDAWIEADPTIESGYPLCAPIGAGMVLRRAAAQDWVKARAAARDALSDRKGTSLSSSGDNDIVMTSFRAGWHMAYAPELSLQHLIPAGRLTRAYLGRLNRGIQTSWVNMLGHHGACAWPPIPRWTLPLRIGRAYLRTQAWRDDPSWIRWQGLAGRFDGQAQLNS